MSNPAPVLFAGSGTSTLPPKQSMSVGQYLVSPNGRYRLILQSDSNLALWDGDTALWAANNDQPYSRDTLRQETLKLTRFFVNGEAVLEDSLRHRLWVTSGSITKEDQRDRCHLVVQDDANVVILDILPVYSSAHVDLQAGTLVNIIPPGTYLEMGRQYPAGNFFLVFQADGNLVVYTKAGVAVWHTHTYGMDAKTAVMQTDGNFVIYSSTGVPLWNTETGKLPGAYAQLQSNGAFVICTGVPVWARFGWEPKKTKSRPVFYPDHTDPVENGTDAFPTYFHIGYEF